MSSQNEGSRNVKSKAAEIEAALIRRMEERMTEHPEAVSEELRMLFENQVAYEIPLLMGEKVRKQRVLDVVNGRGVRREGPVDDVRSPDHLNPPPTNRGVTFNTGSDDPEPFDPCPHIMGGYDGGCEVGFDGHWNPSKFKELTALLQAAKEAVTECEQADERFIDLCGRQFVMSAKSATGGVIYRYMFEGCGVKFLLHSNPKGNIQPVRVRYNAEGLIGRDLFHKHSETLEFLKELGFTVTKEKISRVDLQVMVNRDVGEFMAAVNQGRTVCTARKYQINGDGFNTAPSTFRLGSEVQICIYDKRAELMGTMQANPIKFALMVQECFGESWIEDPVPVTRIEFRLKRDFLKLSGIDSMQDLLEHEQGLARYCCNTWFRIIRDKKSVGHTSTQEVDPIWAEVQAAFEQWFPGVDGHRAPVKPVRVKRPPTNSDHLLIQAAGTLASKVALDIGVTESYHEAFSHAVQCLWSKAAHIFNRSVERAKEWSVKAGVDLTAKALGMCKDDVSRHVSRFQFGMRCDLDEPLLTYQ